MDLTRIFGRYVSKQKQTTNETQTTDGSQTLEDHLTVEEPQVAEVQQSTDEKRSLTRILLVEDNPKHLADAKDLLEGKEGVSIVYASTLCEALGDHPLQEGLLYKRDKTTGYRSVPQVDAVISDVYFPYGIGCREILNESPNGLLVAAKATAIGVPTVLCTAGYHHGEKYEFVSKLASAMGVPLVDKYQDEVKDYNTEAETKDWMKAFDFLMEMIKEGKSD